MSRLTIFTRIFCTEYVFLYQNLSHLNGSLNDSVGCPPVINFNNINVLFVLMLSNMSAIGVMLEEKTVVCWPHILGTSCEVVRGCFIIALL